MSAKRSDARRLQDIQNENEKELLGFAKSIDVRQAETYGCIASLQKNESPQSIRNRRYSTNSTDDSRRGLRFSRFSFSVDQANLDPEIVDWVDRDKAREREILAQNNGFNYKNDRAGMLKEMQNGYEVERGRKNRRNDADLDSYDIMKPDRPTVFRKEVINQSNGRRASGNMQGILDLNSLHGASVVIKKTNIHKDPSRKRLSLPKSGVLVSRALL